MKTINIDVAALTDDQRNGVACCLTGSTEGPMIPVDIETPESVCLFVSVGRVQATTQPLCMVNPSTSFGKWLQSSNWVHLTREGGTVEEYNKALAAFERRNINIRRNQWRQKKGNKQ